MTTRPNTRREEAQALKDIQTKVTSIDENVTELKDRVEERFDGLHQDVEEVKDRMDECLDEIYAPTWYDDSHYTSGNDIDPQE